MGNFPLLTHTSLPDSGFSSKYSQGLSWECSIQLDGGYLYLAPLLDSTPESEWSESSRASERYGASERSGASIEEQRGEGMSKKKWGGRKGAFSVAGGGEFECAGASKILVREGEEHPWQKQQNSCHYGRMANSFQLGTNLWNHGEKAGGHQENNPSQYYYMPWKWLLGGTQGACLQHFFWAWSNQPVSIETRVPQDPSQPTCDQETPRR